MKVSEYIKEYTSGDRISFWHIVDEYKELLVEMSQGNWKGMNEEWQDVLHFLQLWFYWRFNVDGEVWACTSQSVAKFMGRQKVWKDIYEYVGLPRDSSNFCGNYNKFEKVAKQLSKFGIDGKKAKEAYDKIVKV